MVGLVCYLDSHAVAMREPRQSFHGNGAAVNHSPTTIPLLHRVPPPDGLLRHALADLSPNQYEAYEAAASGTLDLPQPFIATHLAITNGMTFAPAPATPRSENTP